MNAKYIQRLINTHRRTLKCTSPECKRGNVAQRCWAGCYVHHHGKRQLSVPAVSSCFLVTEAAEKSNYTLLILKKHSLNVQNLPPMLIFQVSFSRFRCTQMVFPRFLSFLQCTFALIVSVYGSIWMSATVGKDRESCYILPPPLQQPIVQHQVLPLSQSELRRALTDRDSESSLNCLYRRWVWDRCWLIMKAPPNRNWHCRCSCIKSAAITVTYRLCVSFSGSHYCSRLLHQISHSHPFFSTHSHLPCPPSQPSAVFLGNVCSPLLS